LEKSAIMSKKLRDVAIFFAIAFGLTSLASQLPDLAIGTLNIKLHLCGFGPLVSGLICYRLPKTRNAIGVSLLGTRSAFSVAVCLPLTAVCLTQTKHDLTVVLVYALTQFVYCLGEEFGWRHYLQNATSFMN
jgi:membrane protease YdiL (CAAX protease family)